MISPLILSIKRNITGNIVKKLLYISCRNRYNEIMIQNLYGRKQS